MPSRNAQLYKYAAATQNCALLLKADDVVEAAETLEVAQRSGDNTAVAYAKLNHAIAFIRIGSENRAAGFEFLRRARETIVDEQLIVTLARMSGIEIARERARRGS